MSPQTRKNSKPTVTNIDGTSEEVFEGEIHDGEPIAEKTPVIRGFLAKHKQWFIVAGAATVGFVAHGFLARPDTCVVTPALEDFDVEYIEDVSPETE